MSAEYLNGNVTNPSDLLAKFFPEDTLAEQIHKNKKTLRRWWSARLGPRALPKRTTTAESTLYFLARRVRAASLLAR